MSELVTITIDDRELRVPKGTNIVDAALAAVVDPPEDDFAAHRVANDVPRELRDRRRDDGEIRGGQPALRGEFPPLLASGDDVDVGADRHPNLNRDRGGLHARTLFPAGRGTRVPPRGPARSPRLRA